MVRWDPLDHPRDRLGAFRMALGKLKTGDTMALPGGVRLQRRGGKYVDHIRITSPGAKGRDGKPVAATEISLSKPEKIARAAFGRSAMTEHPNTLGGRTSMGYQAFRDAELQSMAADPAMVSVPPVDIDDLLVRPLHGDREDNYARLEDLKSEAESVIEDIEDDPGPRDRETGVRDWRGGQEDAYSEAQDTLEDVNAALKQLEDLPAPPESPGGDASRDYGVARSELRDAEIAYLSAVMDGTGIADAMRRRDEVRARLARVEGRVSSLWKAKGREAARALNAKDAAR